MPTFGAPPGVRPARTIFGKTRQCHERRERAPPERRTKSQLRATSLSNGPARRPAFGRGFCDFAPFCRGVLVTLPRFARIRPSRVHGPFRMPPPARRAHPVCGACSRRKARGTRPHSAGSRCTEPALIGAADSWRLRAPPPGAKKTMERRTEGNALPSVLDCRGFPDPDLRRCPFLKGLPFLTFPQ